MKLTDQNLLRKLVLVLFIKVALLVALWWAFFRDQTAPMNDARVAAQLLQHASKPTQGINK